MQSFLRIWLHLLKKPKMKNFICCAVRGLSSDAKLFTDDVLFFSEIDDVKRSS